MKTDKMSWACGTYGGKYVEDFGWENLKERNHMKDTHKDSRIILKCL
jgi:hypothetical protein